VEQAASDSPKEEGLRLLKAGQVDDAIKVFGDALRANMDDAQLHMYLGICYGQKNDKLHAIHHLETSVNLHEDPKALFNLGMIYESAHRFDEAVRQYRMAVQLDPGYTRAQEALDKLHSQFEAAHPVAAPPAEEPQAEAAAEAQVPADAANSQPQRPPGGIRNLLRFGRKQNGP
jgi:Flp pilus assembly protein TadD